MEGYSVPGGGRPTCVRSAGRTASRSRNRRRAGSEERVALRQQCARRLQQTAKLVEQASRTLRLASTRYELGLGSIVELNQAQLSVAAAETAAASAKYEYQIRRANLDFQIGRIP